MKKLLFVLALAGFTATAQAQTEVPTQKYSVATNSFWSNWFVSAGFAANFAYTDQEIHSGLSKNPFQKGRFGMGGELTIGKWFTPSIGVRLRGNIGQYAQVWYTLDDVNKTYQFNLQGHFLFNLNNIFCGYNPKRVWTISPYAGFGFIHHMVHGGDYAPIATLGLYNQFNVSKRWFLYWDLSVSTSQAELDGIEDFCHANDGIANTRDNMFATSVGVGINIGKTGWEKTPDVAAIMAMHQAQVDALNGAIADQEAENERLKKLLANRKPETKEVIVKEVVASTPASVFFNIGQSRIASKKDLVNVQAIADQAKQNGSKIVVNGYADSKTGSSSFNQKLSEKRANVVAEELVKMGVARENIEINAKGGVDELTPYSYNRRVVVTIK